MSEIDLLRAEISRLTKERDAALSRAERSHQSLTEWMEAGERAGFVFSVRRDGFEVENDPALSREIREIREAELEREVESLKAQLEKAQLELAEADFGFGGWFATKASLEKQLAASRAIPGVPEGWELKEIRVSRFCKADLKGNKTGSCLVSPTPSPEPLSPPGNPEPTAQPVRHGARGEEI